MLHGGPLALAAGGLPGRGVCGLGPRRPGGHPTAPLEPGLLRNQTLEASKDLR